MGKLFDMFERILPEVLKLQIQQGRPNTANSPVPDYGLASAWNLDKKKRCGTIHKMLLDQGLLPHITQKPEKSNQTSEQLRTAGNLAYVRDKNNMDALLLYTKAICNALPESREIVLAYANRSAVTCELQEYNDSVRDIDRALSSCNYPNHLKHKLLERRGKCFFAMSQFSKALEDFTLAKTHLQEGKYDQNKVKLLTAQIDHLIEICHDKQDQTQPSSSYTIRLSHAPSSLIQCASVAVDVKYSPEMGRHVVAATDIKPGDILAIEKPYVSVINQSENYLFCYHCLKRCHSSIPCNSCIEVAYCSQDCRQASWVEYHTIECGILSYMYGIDGGGTALTALRILLKASKCGENLRLFVDDYLGTEHFDDTSGGNVDGKYPSDYYSIRARLTHESSRILQDLLMREIAAVYLVHLLRERTKFFAVSESWPENVASEMNDHLYFNHLVAAHMMVIYSMILTCNAYGVQEVRLFTSNHMKRSSAKIGTALYSFHGLLNHSCDPNVARLTKGDVMHLIAQQPIQRGQQIFDCYRFHYSYDPLPVRQKLLKEHYFFTCKCPACVEDWPLFHDCPDAFPKYLHPDSPKLVYEPTKKAAKMCHDMSKANCITKEQLEFFIEYLPLARKNVHPAWRPYLMSESVIRNFFIMKTNHYISNDLNYIGEEGRSHKKCELYVDNTYF